MDRVTECRDNPVLIMVHSFYPNLTSEFFYNCFLCDERIVAEAVLNDKT